MNIWKALGIAGAIIVGCIAGAVGARVVVNAIDGEPLMQTSKYPAVIEFQIPGSKKEEPKKDNKTNKKAA